MAFNAQHKIGQKFDQGIFSRNVYDYAHDPLHLYILHICKVQYKPLLYIYKFI